MKLGVISDLHGDPVALELAWAHLTVLGADAIVCCGDLVGYGPLPDRVVQFVQERQIPCVRGNHDRWAIERGHRQPDPFGGGNPSIETIDFLKTLSFQHVLEVGGKIVVVVHGSINDDLEFVTRKDHPPRLLQLWLDSLGADALVLGHTHDPGCCHLPDGLVLNPGSVVSAPVVKTSRSFALLDLDTMAATFHDVETGGLIQERPWSIDEAGSTPQ